MNIHTEERIIALAGIMQCATLVHHIARGRWVDPDMFNTCIRSIFVSDPHNTLNVYGDNLANLQMGLRKLSSFFPRPDKNTDGDIARYLFGCILITRTLRKDPARLEIIGKKIQGIQVQSSNFIENPDDLVITQLGQIYLDHIGSLKQRIHVLGSQTILKQPKEVSRLRALLLAGVRSSVLWYQLGGRLWHLWLQRSKIANEAKELLMKI